MVGVSSTKWDNVLWWYCFALGECSLWGVRLDGARVQFGDTPLSLPAIQRSGPCDVIRVFLPQSMDQKWRKTG
eukprot:scaffold9027_cov61-Attheya_sp.AAC.10